MTAPTWLTTTASIVFEPPKKWHRIAASIFIAALTVGGSIVTARLGIASSYSLLVLGVVGVTWYAGLRAALLLTLAAGAVNWAVIDEPRYQLSYKESSLIRLCIGMVTAVLVSYVLDTSKRAKTLADRYAASQAELAAKELELMSVAALTDGLTNLGNHRAFQEDLKLELMRAVRADSPLTLAVFDVDQLKEINDSQGHTRGDEVLIRIGLVLKELSSFYRAYRIGGDEFALIMLDTPEVSALLDLESLGATVARTVEGATVSIGLCANEGGGSISAERLRENADAALYEAKRRGRNQVVSYNAKLQSGAALTLTRIDAINRIIDGANPEMYFQPILNIASRELLAFEALLRLPGTEVEGPQQAFEIAARIGRSRDFDLVCAARALDTAKKLPPGVKIFINLAPPTLLDPSFSPADFCRMAKERDVALASIVFEVTERTTLPAPLLALSVRALEECGFAIALDDVGVGNSGLEMMRLEHYEYLKIDRSVIIDAISGVAGKAIIRAILGFASETGSSVIAEGIENREMLSIVRRYDVPPFLIEAVQGNLFGQPQPSVEGFLARTDRRISRQNAKQNNQDRAA